MTPSASLSVHSYKIAAAGLAIAAFSESCLQNECPSCLLFDNSRQPNVVHLLGIQSM